MKNFEGRIKKLEIFQKSKSDQALFYFTDSHGIHHVNNESYNDEQMTAFLEQLENDPVNTWTVINYVAISDIKL